VLVLWVVLFFLIFAAPLGVGGAGAPGEALLPAPTVAVALIQQAVKSGLYAAYVVCDCNRMFNTSYEDGK
jgi:hypothetical protein